MTREHNGYTRRSILKKGAITTGALVLGGTAASGTATAGIGDGWVLDYHLNNINYDRDRGEIVSNFVHDASPAHNDGEWEGDAQDPVVKDGAVGNAYELVAEEKDDEEGYPYDYIAAPDDDSLDLTEACTLAAWVKCGDQRNYARVLSREQSGQGNRQYNLGFDSNGVHPRTIVDTQDGDGQQVTANTDVTDESWHHLAMTFENGGELRIYVDDGTPEDSVSVDSALVSRDSIFAVGTAAHLGASWVQYEGLVDEVRVYNRALSDAEITELYEMRD